jgi:hypothetical protein
MEWYAPAIVAWALQPLRVFVIDPTLAVQSVFLPLVVPTLINPVVARCVDLITVPVLSILYPVDEGPNKSSSSSSNSSSRDDVTKAAVKAISKPSVVAVQPPSYLQSAFQGAVSFVCSAIGDIAGLMSNPKKFEGWISALGQFNTFLQQSGVGDEMEEAIQKPLLGGRLLDNFKVGLCVNIES